MKERVNSVCQTESVVLDLKAKRRPRFKAGSELSAKVNLVAVELNEETIDDTEIFELKLELQFERCVQEECA